MKVFKRFSNLSDLTLFMSFAVLFRVAFRCSLRLAIRRQSVASRSCSHACLTRRRTPVFGPAPISLPWKKSGTSWEKS